MFEYLFILKGLNQPQQSSDPNLNVDLLQIADYLGVFVFALSGGVAASRKQMDLFGILVVSMLPAIGGGTLRDIILDQPVFWLQDSTSILIAVVAGLVVYFFFAFVEQFRMLVWLDALGLALFAAIGADKTAELEYGPVIVVVMGTITASFGGLIRDIVCNEIPLILRKDIYATAALLGSAAYWLCTTVGATAELAFTIAFLVAFVIRAVVLSRTKPNPVGEIDTGSNEDS